MRIHSGKLPVPRRFYNPSDIFSELGLIRGRNLNVDIHADIKEYTSCSICDKNIRIAEIITNSFE